MRRTLYSGVFQFFIVFHVKSGTTKNHRIELSTISCLSDSYLSEHYIKPFEWVMFRKTLKNCQTFFPVSRKAWINFWFLSNFELVATWIRISIKFASLSYVLFGYTHRIISNKVHRLLVTLSYFQPDRFVQLLSLIPILILLLYLLVSIDLCILVYAS